MKIISLTLFAILALIACRNKESQNDASGSFEAVETIVSAEASGSIKVLNLEEGQTLQAGQIVGYIDSVQLFLKKKQLQAQVNAVLSKSPDIGAQTASLQEQLRQAEREQRRTANLVKEDAATRKQLDDVNSQITVIKKQISAQRSSLGITSSSLIEETIPLNVQIQQLNDQIKKCRIINEVKGTVLTKYAEVNEVTAVGKPIYKIADLSSIILRAYITGEQISEVKPGQQVKVLVDDANNTYKTYPGTIEWISNKAEFTPKTIQTKDERANLVYALKVRVNNDGFLKIGMYGELKF